MSAITAAAVGIAATASGTYMSFRQAGQQGKAAARARQEADKAIAEARKRAEENVYKSLSLTKDPYERAREAALVTGAQAIEAGRESERGAAATAGRVQMAQNQLQGQIADVQSQEIQDLNKLVASEDARLKDYLAKISLAEAEGAQQAEADALKLKAQATAQGVQQIGALAGEVGKALPLFYKSKGAKAYGKLADQATTAGLDQKQFQSKVAGLSQTPGFESLAGVEAMKPLEFQDFLSQNPELIRNIMGQNIFSTTAVSAPPYVERPSSTNSVLLAPSAPPVSKTAGSYTPSDLKMLPPALLKAYGIDPFSL